MHGGLQRSQRWPTYSILSFDYRGGIGGAFLFEKLLTGGIRLVPKSLLQISITR
jgi:hypothetical protein